jgi:hypothetical protein
MQQVTPNLAHHGEDKRIDFSTARVSIIKEQGRMKNMHDHSPLGLQT